METRILSSVRSPQLNDLNKTCTEVSLDKYRTEHELISKEMKDIREILEVHEKERRLFAHRRFDLNQAADKLKRIENNYKVLVMGKTLTDNENAALKKEIWELRQVISKLEGKANSCHCILM